MSHNDTAGKQGDNSRKAKQLPNEIGNIPSQQNQTGLLDGIAIEGLIDFEQVAESEPRDGSDGDAEEHQDEEFHDHVHDCVQP
jgi:hypothetical protein